MRKLLALTRQRASDLSVAANSVIHNERLYILKSSASRSDHREGDFGSIVRRPAGRLKSLGNDSVAGKSSGASASLGQRTDATSLSRSSHLLISSPELISPVRFLCGGRGGSPVLPASTAAIQ